MGIVETALNLASNQWSGKIAKVIGKSEGQVKGAIQQASKVLPEILNSKDGGISVLNRMGIDKPFMDDMYQKYSKHASKIPGLNTSTIGSTLSAIEKAMGNKSAPKQAQKKSEGFDSKKYPKI